MWRGGEAQHARGAHELRNLRSQKRGAREVKAAQAAFSVRSFWRSGTHHMICGVPNASPNPPMNGGHEEGAGGGQVGQRGGPPPSQTGKRKGG